jgi:hypothetical protein
VGDPRLGSGRGDVPCAGQRRQVVAVSALRTQRCTDPRHLAGRPVPLRSAHAEMYRPTRSRRRSCGSPLYSRRDVPTPCRSRRGSPLCARRDASSMRQHHGSAGRPAPHTQRCTGRRERPGDQPPVRFGSAERYRGLSHPRTGSRSLCRGRDAPPLVRLFCQASLSAPHTQRCVQLAGGHRFIGHRCSLA